MDKDTIGETTLPDCKRTFEEFHLAGDCAFAGTGAPAMAAVANNRASAGQWPILCHAQRDKIASKEKDANYFRIISTLIITDLVVPFICQFLSHNIIAFFVQ